MLEVTRTADSTAAVHTKIIELITARGQSRERYAALRNRARTQAADALIAEIRYQMGELEQRQGKRKYKRRATSEGKLIAAIERFVGDLRRVRTGMTSPANVYRAIGRSRFDDAKVKYDLFTQVLDGLKALGLVFHLKGLARYRRTPFGNAPERGHAARFWATGKLMRLAARYGIHTDNVSDHFAPEPPKNPLVLKDYAVGKGKDRESGRRIKWKNTRYDTAEAKRLEEDVRELNAFLAGYELTGGEHYGYERMFNNLSWRKGGRLYSSGEQCYQRLSEAERLKMTGRD